MTDQTTAETDVCGVCFHPPGAEQLAAALDRVLALAAELTEQADRAEVGSDAYINLHTIADAIREAAATGSTT